MILRFLITICGNFRRAEKTAINTQSHGLWKESLMHLLKKRTMMVLYRSPEYQAVKVDNEDKYQIPKFKAKWVWKR